MTDDVLIMLYFDPNEGNVVEDKTPELTALGKFNECPPMFSTLWYDGHEYEIFKIVFAQGTQYNSPFMLSKIKARRRA